MKTNFPDTTGHCTYCGHTITDEVVASERFGERFCSEAHAEEFVAGVRAARMEAIARPEKTGVREATKGGDACALASPAERGWSAYLKRAACWGAPRSEEHTSELQSRLHLVCRLLLEKKKMMTA